MIEKWDGETPSEKWKAKLIYELQDKKYDTEDDILSLEIDPFEDVIEIKVEGSKFIFTLHEAVYMTTAMREENMKFIIHFFREELPYLQFEKDVQSSSYGEHWFRLIFKLKGIQRTVKLQHLKEKDYYIISNVISNIYLTRDEVRQLVELLKEEGF